MIEFVDSASKRIQGQARGWASSNAAGEFQLDLPQKSTGFAFLLIRAIGYEPAVLALAPRQYPAYALEVDLSSSAFHDPQAGLGVHAIRGIRLCLP